MEAGVGADRGGRVEDVAEPGDDAVPVIGPHISRAARIVAAVALVVVAGRVGFLFVLRRPAHIKTRGIADVVIAANDVLVRSGWRGSGAEVVVRSAAAGRIGIVLDKICAHGVDDAGHIVVREWIAIPAGSVSAGTCDVLARDRVNATVGEDTPSGGIVNLVYLNRVSERVKNGTAAAGDQGSGKQLREVAGTHLRSGHGKGVVDG